MSTFDDPTAFLRSQLSDEHIRIKEMQETLKAIYVGSERDDQIQFALGQLIMNACMRRDPTLPHSAENRVPGIGFAVLGESGAGKSRAIEHAFRKHPAFPGYGTSGSGCALLSIEAPSPCTLQQLAVEILKTLSYDVSRDLRENKAWRRARDQLKLNKILFLHVGECQRVMHQASDYEIRKVADTLIGLMESNDWPIQLILSGVPELEGLLKVDRQLRRRLEYVSFSNVSAVEDGDLVENAIRVYAEAAGLKVKNDPDSELVGRLCHAACYQLGLVMKIITEAIISCLRDQKNALSLEDFANAYTRKTLEPLERNPFIVRAWDKIDCSVLREKLKEPTADSLDADVKQRRRKRRS